MKTLSFQHCTCTVDPSGDFPSERKSTVNHVQSAPHQFIPRFPSMHDLNNHRAHLEEISKISAQLTAPSYEHCRQRIIRDTKSIFEESKFGVNDKFTFDRLVRLTQRTFRSHFAGMTLIGPKEIEIVVSVGFGEGHIPPIDRSIAPCAQLANETSPPHLLVVDMLQDSYFSTHPFVTGPMGMRSYFGVPLFLEGYRVGTFFIADVRARPDLDNENSLKTLLELSNIVVSILQEQRWKSFRFDIDFTKISIGLFSHLKLPIRDTLNRMSEASQNIREVAGSELITVDQALKCVNMVDDLKKSISFLALAVENCLRLSLTLLNRINKNQDLDLIDVEELPLLIEELVNNIFVQDVNATVVWSESPTMKLSVPLDDYEKSAENRVRVDVSMLWIILLSLLWMNDQKSIRDLRITMSLRQLEASSPSSSTTSNAILAMSVSFNSDSPQEDSKSDCSLNGDYTLQLALNYLLIGVGGRFKALDPDGPAITSHAFQIEIPVRICASSFILRVTPVFV